MRETKGLTQCLRKFSSQRIKPPCKLSVGWCHIAANSEGPHTKISKRVKTAMQRSKMYRRSERLKRLQCFAVDWNKGGSSFGIPSRKQPLLFSVHKRCHDKTVSSFQGCVLICTTWALVSRLDFSQKYNFCLESWPFSGEWGVLRKLLLEVHVPRSAATLQGSWGKTFTDWHLQRKHTNRALLRSSSLKAYKMGLANEFA